MAAPQDGPPGLKAQDARLRECVEIQRTLQALGAVPAAQAAASRAQLVAATNAFVRDGADAQVVVRFEQAGPGGQGLRGRSTGRATVTLRAREGRQSGVALG